jgi:hypothetical protein
METFTIVPRGGTYSVVATTEGGKRKTVATYPTEDGAITLLRRLQEKAGLPDSSKHHPKNWRF